MKLQNDVVDLRVQEGTKEHVGETENYNAENSDKT